MGLSLAIGMLIDDAIVVRENIVRHMQQGKDHLTAAREGTAEIGLAVMATTFTIIAVFIPVAFMGGMVGQFFYQFGITVAAAVLVSLFVSFTLDPMLSSRWYDPDVEEHRRRGDRRPACCSGSTGASTTCTGPTSASSTGRCATGGPSCAVAVRGVRQRVPDPRDPRRRLHARLQPRRVPGVVQGDARRDPARDGRPGAADGGAAATSCPTSITPTPPSARPGRSSGP